MQYKHYSEECKPGKYTWRERIQEAAKKKFYVIYTKSCEMGTNFSTPEEAEAFCEEKNKER